MASRKCLKQSKERRHPDLNIMLTTCRPIELVRSKNTGFCDKTWVGGRGGSTWSLSHWYLHAFLSSHSDGIIEVRQVY